MRNIVFSFVAGSILGANLALLLKHHQTTPADRLEQIITHEIVGVPIVSSEYHADAAARARRQ